MAQQIACGVDIGGSGVKGALVHVDSGQLAGERVRFETPAHSTPPAVADTVAAVLQRLGIGAETPVGVTVPAPIVHDVVAFIANLDKAWAGTNVHELLREHLGRDVVVLNDADAAGLAEMRFGAGRGHRGVVIVTTLGTGIGSALFVDGILVPNTELGHLEIDGHDAESRASAAQRTKNKWGWKEWAKRLQRYYSHLEMLFSPDLIVVGGGVSRRADQFLPLLDLRTPIVPARLRNEAGIIGAASLAAA